MPNNEIQMGLARKLLEATMLNDPTFPQIIKNGEYEGVFSDEEMQRKELADIISEASAQGLITEVRIGTIEKGKTISFTLTELGENLLSDVAREREAESFDIR